MEALTRIGSPFSIGVGSQAEGSIWGSLLFSAPLYPVLACLDAFWTSSLRGEGFVQLPSPPSLFALFSSLGRLFRRAKQVKEWEAWYELPSQMHPSQVGTLSNPTDWTLVCAKYPSCRLLVRMVGRDQGLKFPGTRLGWKLQICPRNQLLLPLLPLLCW